MPGPSNEHAEEGACGVRNKITHAAVSTPEQALFKLREEAKGHSDAYGCYERDGATLTKLRDRHQRQQCAENDVLPVLE